MIETSTILTRWVAAATAPASTVEEGHAIAGFWLPGAAQARGSPVRRAVGRRPQRHVLADHHGVEAGVLGDDGEVDEPPNVTGIDQGVVLGEDHQQPRDGSGLVGVDVITRP